MFGLSFLQPLLLWASLAATVPLVLHLLRRQRFRELPFSGLIFLSPDLRRQLRASRLTHLLLLALRVLLVLALCLAIAGPQIGGLGFLGQATSLAIVVDQSASMGVRTGGQTALQRARTLVLQRLKSLRPSDRVTLIGAMRQPMTYAVESADGAEESDELMEHLEPTALSGGLEAAILEAASILEQSELPRRRLLVLSDGQETLGPLGELARRGIELEWVSVRPAPAGNLYVADLVLPRLPSIRSERRFALRIANGGGATAAGSVRLNLAGAYLGERPIELRPGASTDVRFDVAVGPGVQFGFIELTGDDLAADNLRFFVLGLDVQLTVAVIGPPASRRYVELALEVQEESSRAGFQVQSFDKISDASAEGLEPPRAAVVCDLDSINSAEIEALGALRRGGTGVLLFLGPGTAPSLANELLAAGEALPLRLTGRQRGSWTARPASPRHRVLPGSHALDGALGAVNFSQRQRMLPLGGGGRSVLLYSDGEPLLTELQSQAPPVFVAATAADRAFGDLVVSPYFVLLLRRTVDELGGLSERSGLTPGSDLPPLPASVGAWEWVGDPRDLRARPISSTSLRWPGVLLRRDARGVADEWVEVVVEAEESHLAYAERSPSKPEASNGLEGAGDLHSLAFAAAVAALLLFLVEGLLTARLSEQEATG